MRVDLHIHSNYSDSSRSPEEIVSIAKNKNVGLISVCDHGTIAAYDRVLNACKNNDIYCVLGIELSAMWKNEDLHMLTYNFDRDNQDIESLIYRQYQEIECDYIVYNMSLDYPQMSLEDYKKFEYPKEKGGWKYLYYAVAKGVTSTYEEANSCIFSKYSTPNHLFDFEECHLSDFCSTVKQASGISVLAHPGYLHEKFGSDMFIKFLIDAKECGIGGIECYYPSHSEDVTSICVDFCKKNDLRITCGCDCHGDYDKSDGFTIGR